MLFDATTAVRMLATQRSRNTKPLVPYSSKWLCFVPNCNSCREGRTFATGLQGMTVGWWRYLATSSCQVRVHCRGTCPTKASCEICNNKGHLADHHSAWMQPQQPRRMTGSYSWKSSANTIPLPAPRSFQQTITHDRRTANSHVECIACYTSSSRAKRIARRSKVRYQLLLNTNCLDSD